MQKAIEAVPRDRPAINAARARVFSRVVIEPESGMLRYIWSHAPEHDTLPGWPAGRLLGLDIRVGHARFYSWYICFFHNHP